MIKPTLHEVKQLAKALDRMDKNSQEWQIINSHYEKIRDEYLMQSQNANPLYRVKKMVNSCLSKKTIKKKVAALFLEIDAMLSKAIDEEVKKTNER